MIDKLSKEKYLHENLQHARLIGFKLRQQFIELEFYNAKFEQIMFFLDCDLSTPNIEIAEKVSSLKKLDIYAYKITYFIKANQMCIQKSHFDIEGNFVIMFENKYEIIFHLKSDDIAEIDITFKINMSSKVNNISFFINDEKIDIS